VELCRRDFKVLPDDGDAVHTWTDWVKKLKDAVSYMQTNATGRIDLIHNIAVVLNVDTKTGDSIFDKQPRALYVAILTDICVAMCGPIQKHATKMSDDIMLEYNPQTNMFNARQLPAKYGHVELDPKMVTVCHPGDANTYLSLFSLGFSKECTYSGDSNIKSNVCKLELIWLPEELYRDHTSPYRDVNTNDIVSVLEASQDIYEFAEKKIKSSKINNYPVKILKPENDAYVLEFPLAANTHANYTFESFFSDVLRQCTIRFGHIDVILGYPANVYPNVLPNTRTLRTFDFLRTQDIVEFPPAEQL
jgi:hypothetical protein